MTTSDGERTMPRMTTALLLGGAMLLPAMPAFAQDAPQFRRACAADIERLCAGVPPGEGRIKACMKAHIQEVTAPCFDALLGAIAAEKEPG